MSRAQRLIQEAIEFGDVPDFINPERKRKIEREEHPHAGFLPRGSAERFASETYPDIVRKLARYSGLSLAQLRQNPGQMQQMVMQAFAGVQANQQEHAAELEQAAIDVVLQLPEFKSLRRALEGGRLKLDVKLTDQIDTAKMRPEEQSDEEIKAAEEDEFGLDLDLDVEEVAAELDLEREKRQIVNLMIQGAASNKNYAYHLAADTLNAIDPNLLNQYGLIMSFGELGYWMAPEEAISQAYRSGSGAGGSAELDAEEDGVVTIRVRALFFPLLVHELVKGLLEYLSHMNDDDDQTRRYVGAKANTLSNETWDLKLGGAAWRQFMRAVGEDNQDLLPHIYRDLVELPTGEFKQVMQGVMSGDPQVLRRIRTLVQEYRDEERAGMEESKAGKWVQRLLRS